MLSPEHIGLFNTPVDRTVGDGPGSAELKNAQNQPELGLSDIVITTIKNFAENPDMFFQYLAKKQDLHSPFFEALIDKTGIEARLEQVGLLSRAIDPNPYHFEREAQQHKQWWKEHQAEGEKFIQNLDKREEVLNYLYIGAVLGYLLNEPTSPPSSVNQ